MKALLCRTLGGPELLELADVEAPVAGPGEVAIDIEACGVNFADSLIIQGKYQVKPALPFAPGMEVAGRIAALGEGVTGLAVGDPVIGMVGTGGFAERVVTSARRVRRRPATVDATIAAAIPVAYGTAHLGLHHRARLRPGETLLVHGASGGVGLAAVEVGKRMGATVIATASSAEKLAVASEHGADHVINYADGEFRETVKALTGGRGADVIFDPVGGDVFDQSLRCIAWEGRLLVVGFAAGRIPELPANLLLVKNFAALGVFWGAYLEKDPEVASAAFEELMAWLGEGALRPHVSSVHDLAHGADAIRELAERRATGKVVVTP